MENKTAEEILKEFGCHEIPFDENVTMYYPSILSAMEEYASIKLAEKDKEIERLKELLKTRLYDIDFSGNVLARIEITNNHPTIIGAMNGYGDAIAPSNCSISLNK